MKTTNLAIEFGVKPVAICIAVVEEEAVEILKEIVATNPPFEVSINYCLNEYRGKNKVTVVT